MVFQTMGESALIFPEKKEKKVTRTWKTQLQANAEVEIDF